MVKYRSMYCPYCNGKHYLIQFNILNFKLEKKCSYDIIEEVENGK